MKKTIVGIGACVMDTLYRVPKYPTEDTKCRATESKTAGGGPCATGLVAVRKLGADAAYIGNLSSDAGGRFLYSDFKKYGVDVSNVTVLDGYRSFTSVLCLSEGAKSHTCIFDKGDLPALALNEAQKDAIKGAALLLVDGNELDAAVDAAKLARAYGVPVLYDCGGLYPNVERLLEYTDIMIPSEEFAMGHTGKASAADAAVALYEMYHPEVVIVTQGKCGGTYYDGETLTKYPAYPAEVVDSNGAGDVFHGAYAYAVTKGISYLSACHFASATSAIKCMGFGARESVPNAEAVITYLKENGYEL